MATIGSIHVHECSQVSARADRSFEDLSVTWLELRFGPSAFEPTVCITMPYERAEQIAAAINNAELTQALQPQAIQIEHMPAAAE